MHDDLIFDVGMQHGEDTEFYLRKGFRVIAVDADPELCEVAEKRFAAEIADGRLTVVSCAISDTPGRVTLYKNIRPSWNTLSPVWAQRNLEKGAESFPIEVSAITLDSLIERYGVPYYLKIDIEGMDVASAESLAGREEQAKYLSLESSLTSFPDVKHEFDVLSRLGYRHFKLVPQHRITSQKPPQPALEGEYVEWTFSQDSTGLFGEEAPGKWLTKEEAIDAYRPIFLRYALTGNDPLVRSRYVRAILRRIGFRSGWYDTHAKL